MATEPSGPDPARKIADGQLLADEIARLGVADLLLVVTGAGISAPSGLATFRGSDPDAIWKASDVELATEGMFERDPVAQWSWYLDRFSALEDAQPNPAHEALVELERHCAARKVDFLVVTQNIDTLHEISGLEHLIKVHGTSDRFRCSTKGCALGSPDGSIARSEVDLRPFERDPRVDTLPRCPECDALLRAHVLFFDEFYDGHSDYHFREVQEAAQRATLVLFVGTSFSVGVTDLVVRTAAMRGVPTYSIDPHGGQTPRGVRPVQQPAEQLLPSLVERLAAQ